MINLNFRSKGLALALPLTVFVFSSSTAFAEVYKWSNARGVTQYANSRAVSNATQATPNEIVNALLTKDVCTSASSNSNVNSSLNIMPSFNVISDMFASFNLPAKVDALNASLKSTVEAIPNIFVADAQAAVGPVVQVGLMPAVDISTDITPAAGFSELRVKPTTDLPIPGTGGAFRVICTPSHMSNDDPVVYPFQQGAAHHHTFFGNTSVNYKSDLMTFATTGNSTCKGGIMNRSAYWMPSMIDTASKTAVKPDVAIFYYKNGRTPPGLINAPPKGLRMIAGNSKATSADTSKANFTCLSRVPFYGWKQSIPTCNVGETMQMHVAFPQCWDGKNLDSPDHQSHMAYTVRTLTTANKCPTSHPIALPEVTVNFNYKVTATHNPASWRLASDNYAASLPGGFSGHADWVNGWDENFMAGIVKNCINKSVDCRAHLLGDGRMFY